MSLHNSKLSRHGLRLLTLAIACLTLSVNPALAEASEPAEAPTSDHIFIVGGMVHIGDGKIVPNAIVEIQGTKIVAVHEAYTLANIPSDARTIDATGKSVTPGLIGADTSLGLMEIEMEASTRDHSRRDDSLVRSGYRPSTAINADSSLLQIQAIEGITSAAIAPSGGLLSGQVAWIDLLQGQHKGIVYSPSVAVDGQLGQAVAGSRAATISMLRRTLEDARVLRSRGSAYERRQLRDLVADAADLEALFPVLDGEIPLTLTANRASDLLAALELAKEFELKLVVLGGAEAWKVRAELAQAGVIVIVQPSSNLPQSFESLGSRLENAALLHKAGVKVGIAVFGDPHNVRNARQEAGIAASYGLPRAAALSAVTQVIAQAYGMERSHGSLEPGKIANVVIWSGDPLELSSWPEAVIIRGAQIPLVSRQSQLRDRYLLRLRSL